MDITLIILSSVFALGFVFLYLQIKSQAGNKDNQALTEWLKTMQGSMDNLKGTMSTDLKDVRDQLNKTSDTLSSRVDNTTKSLNERLDMAAHVIGNVQKELGAMSEIGRGMKDLQDFLRSPKLRGNIGEQVLKELLSQMLPQESFELQYTFRNGERVDALLKVEDGFISVDSKFPMENFKAMMTSETSETRESYKKLFLRDVKKHIDDISKKYIVPTEGTVDFALMYIPSEAIYYEVVVNNSEMGEYSWQKRVLPVSPNLFYSYLKAILIGLEGKKVESRAKEILQSIRGIKEESNKFSENLRVLVSHINNSKNKAEDVIKVYERLENKIDGLDKIKSPDQRQLL